LILVLFSITAGVGGYFYATKAQAEAEEAEAAEAEAEEAAEAEAEEAAEAEAEEAAAVQALEDTLPTPWVCSESDNSFVPGRITSYTNKTVECMSFDGQNCLWSGDLQSCEANLKTTTPLIPLKTTSSSGKTDTPRNWMDIVFNQI
jgi:hypothetical protein